MENRVYAWTSTCVCFLISLMEYNGINVDNITVVILSVLLHTWKTLLYQHNTMFLIWRKCDQVKHWHNYNEILLIMIRPVNLLTWLLPVKSINKQASFSQDAVSSSRNTIWVDCWQVIYTEFHTNLLEGKNLGKMWVKRIVYVSSWYTYNSIY